MAKAYLHINGVDYDLPGEYQSTEDQPLQKIAEDVDRALKTGGGCVTILHKNSRQTLRLTGQGVYTYGIWLDQHIG